jgi:hypothetical protein
MFDNLRQQMSSDNQPDAELPARRGGGRGFLGLKPSQLFILSLMLFLNVTVLGCFALIAFDKVYLGF